jgi:hypothetical protein
MDAHLKQAMSTGEQLEIKLIKKQGKFYPVFLFKNYLSPVLFALNMV